MCENNNIREDECRCINEILTVIHILQQNASCPDACLDTCDRGFLGYSVSSVNCNTRPVMLYTCSGNGTPWSMPITRDEVVCDEVGTTCSSVFRVEKLDGCCATFRVLAPNTDSEEATLYPYVATNAFFTMNLNCVCALRCLNDTFICL